MGEVAICETTGILFVVGDRDECPECDGCDWTGVNVAGNPEEWVA